MDYKSIDTHGLLNKSIEHVIDKDRRIQGFMKEEIGVTEERDGLITIMGIIVDDVEKTELTNNQGKLIKAVNFSVISIDVLGKKSFHNCTVYDEQEIATESFKKGDYVRIFGKVRAKIKINNKLYSNVQVLDSEITEIK